jgi:hypothetical protein
MSFYFLRRFDDDVTHAFAQELRTSHRWLGAGDAHRAGEGEWLNRRNTKLLKPGASGPARLGLV